MRSGSHLFLMAFPAYTIYKQDEQLSLKMTIISTIITRIWETSWSALPRERGACTMSSLVFMFCLEKNKCFKLMSVSDHRQWGKDAPLSGEGRFNYIAAASMAQICNMSSTLQCGRQWQRSLTLENLWLEQRSSNIQTQNRKSYYFILMKVEGLFFLVVFFFQQVVQNWLNCINCLFSCYAYLKNSTISFFHQDNISRSTSFRLATVQNVTNCSAPRNWVI